MPIVGLTTSDRPMPVRLGVLRKGGAKIQKDNREIVGPDLKHFRFDAGPDESLAMLFSEIFGDTPNGIPVLLPFKTAEENFEAWQEAYVASGLTHRCDGEFVWERNHAGELYRTDKKCPGNCKQTGRLMVIIPALAEQGRFGITTVQTTSKWDIATLSQLLKYYEMLAGGNLRGVPFILSRKPRAVTVTTNNGRSRMDKWLIQIEPAPEWIARRLADAQRLALSAGSVAALPAPEMTEDDDDDDNVIEHQPLVNQVTGEILEPVTVDPELAKAEHAYQRWAREADELGLVLRANADSGIFERKITAEELKEVAREVANHVSLYKRYVEMLAIAEGVGIAPNAIMGTEEARTSLDYQELRDSAADLAEKIIDTIAGKLPQESHPPEGARLMDWVGAFNAQREALPF